MKFAARPLFLSLGLVLSSCAIAIPGIASPTPEVNTLGPVAVAGNFSLITEPNQGYNPVYQVISGAKHTIDLVIYELNDKHAENLLVADKARGVKVRVILNKTYTQGQNQAAYNFLLSKGVGVHWASSRYALTHEKAVVVDGATALIMTGNLTAQYYASTRDFGIIDKDGKDVAAIESTFSADYNGTALTAPNGDDLLWSPGSTDELVGLIGAAKSQLLIENEEMSDPSIVSALEAAAERGVVVDVCMTYSSDWASEFGALSKAGVHVATYAANASLYIHAKVVLVDPGKTSGQVFVGSENFTAASLKYNRELGLVLRDPSLESALTSYLNSDFHGAKTYK